MHNTITVQSHIHIAHHIQMGTRMPWTESQQNYSAMQIFTASSHITAGPYQAMMFSYPKGPHLQSACFSAIFSLLGLYYFNTHILLIIRHLRSIKCSLRPLIYSVHLGNINQTSIAEQSYRLTVWTDHNHCPKTSAKPIHRLE